MSTPVIVLLCAAPLLPIIVGLALQQRRRERQALRDFAALLDGSTVKARGAHGRWKGMDVSVRWAGRTLVHPIPIGIPVRS